MLVWICVIYFSIKVFNNLNNLLMLCTFFFSLLSVLPYLIILNFLKFTFLLTKESTHKILKFLLFLHHITIISSNLCCADLLLCLGRKCWFQRFTWFIKAKSLVGQFSLRISFICSSKTRRERELYPPWQFFWS